MESVKKIFVGAYIENPKFGQEDEPKFLSSYLTLDMDSPAAEAETFIHMLGEKGIIALIQIGETPDTAGIYKVNSAYLEWDNEQNFNLVDEPNP